MAITTNMNTAGTQNNTLDPNQRKKAPILPYVDPGKNLQPTQPANNPFTADGQPFSFQAPQVNPNNVQGVQSNYTPDQGNTDVLRAAQNRAIQGFQSPTLDQTSQLTQQLLQNPQGNFNPQQQMQRNMEAFDQQRAQAMEAARQQMAGTMHSGQTRGDFLDLAIQGGQQRAGFESEQQQALQKQEMTNLLNAIAQGRETSETERQRFATDIGALTDVRQSAEGMENRSVTVAENAMDRGMQIALANQDAQLQTNLTELKGKIDQNMLLTQQDFQAVQADLDRNLQQVIAEGDWGNAVQIERMRADLQVQMQQAEQQFQRAERVATQDYMTSERVSEQDFQTAQRYLQHELNEAAANNDVERQGYLLDKQAQWDLKMQTNGFDQQEKMAYLDAQLEEARAQNDVERQKDILQFQTQQELQLMAQEQGWQEAQNYLQRQHELAVQNNDIVAQQAIQTASIEANAREAALDRSHDLQMQQLQHEFTRAGMSWEAVMSNIENLPADQAAQVLWEEGQKAGIEGMGPNPALLREVANVRERYNHPNQPAGDAEIAWNNRAAQLGLTPEQAKEIWNYQGEDYIDTALVSETAALVRNGGYASATINWGSDEGKAVIEALRSDPTVLNGVGGHQKYNGDVGYSNLETALSTGQPVNIGGNIGIVVSSYLHDTSGTDKKAYKVQWLTGGTAEYKT